MNVDRLNRVTLPSNGIAPNTLPATPTNLATALYAPGRQWTEVNNELLANNTDFSAKFSTGMARHSLVAGVDITREERNSVARTILAGAANQPAPTIVSDPDPYRFGGNFGLPGATTVSNATTVGAYLADQVKITDWFELLGGVRYDNFDAKSGTTTSATADRQDVELAGRRRIPSDQQQQHLCRCGERRSIRPPSS